MGLESGDDAGVYRLSDRIALVQTVDFFTPIVDDPVLFGEIAAANALSDVYAMGGRPLTALNLVGFSVSRYGADTLAAILRGGAAKVREAGAVIVGGHTIDDAEPKYGLAVTGVVDPDQVWTNKGARPGDVLILTKPIGTGVLSTALKRDLAPPAAVEAMVETMRTLNRAAAEAGQAVGGIHAATDVTGFGLLGHASHIARESGVALVIEAEAVPVLPGARELAERDVFPGGSRANRQHSAAWWSSGGPFPSGRRGCCSTPSPRAASCWWSNRPAPVPCWRNSTAGGSVRPGASAGWKGNPAGARAGRRRGGEGAEGA